jgi:hypothetical protein
MAKIKKTIKIKFTSMSVYGIQKIFKQNKTEFSTVEEF